MTNLFFFGSDQYSQTVLTHLRSHSNLTITHFPDLQSLTNSVMVQWSNGLTPLGLSASFPYLFPPDLISAFGGHLYNLHPSLLPQYRNVAPVPYAIALGDTETGITLQRIDEKIDHGEIIAQIKEPIFPEDTTPILLHRLFTQGTQLFLRSVLVGCKPNQKPTRTDLEGAPLIFTHKLTSESGHLEWPVLLKLLNHQPITFAVTTNPLIRLRLTHHPDRTKNILPDLIRALEGYTKVWTVAKTRKGTLRITLVLKGSDLMGRSDPQGCSILIPGKPRPITWSDFTKYYLNA